MRGVQIRRWRDEAKVKTNDNFRAPQSLPWNHHFVDWEMEAGYIVEDNGDDGQFTHDNDERFDVGSGFRDNGRMGSSRDERSTCCFQVLLLSFTGMTNRDCIWKLGKVRSAEKGVRGDGDRGGSPVSSGQRVPGTPNLMAFFRDEALSSGSRGGERGSAVSVICYPG